MKRVFGQRKIAYAKVGFFVAAVLIVLLSTAIFCFSPRDTRSILIINNSGQKGAAEVLKNEMMRKQPNGQNFEIRCDEDMRHVSDRSFVVYFGGSQARSNAEAIASDYLHGRTFVYELPVEATCSARSKIFIVLGDDISAPI